MDKPLEGVALADGTVRALAHLLAGTVRTGQPEAQELVRRNKVDLIAGLELPPDITLTGLEARLRDALGMAPRPEGLPDCNQCGQSLGITPDGLCASCAATAMLTTVLHPERALGIEDGGEDDWDGEDGEWDE